MIFHFLVQFRSKTHGISPQIQSIFGKVQSQSSSSQTDFPSRSSDTHFPPTSSESTPPSFSSSGCAMSSSSGGTPQLGKQISEVDHRSPFCEILNPEVLPVTSHMQNCKMENSGYHQYGNTITVKENYNPLDYFNKAFLRQAKKEEQKPCPSHLNALKVP